VHLPLNSTTALDQVDSAIFNLRYFGHCLDCTFCQDGCCQHGCDVNLNERDRILAEAEAIEPTARAPRDRWFGEEVREDPDYETGRFVRTQRVDGACVFLRRDGRGCGLHSFAISAGRDYHQLKPKVCWLFPITWDRGVLRPSYDITDDLVCRNQGPILYDMVRDELAVAFGAGLVAELDRLRVDFEGVAGRPSR
jgi:Fe-S-cluster containining protein